MFPRSLLRPAKSFFLLGPRGTGKSTWLRGQHYEVTIDLLQARMRLALERDPQHLRELVGHLKPGAWVLIDEVQKVPALLDEVHSLYEERKLHFALSGSSARKLKRSQANLLAGRALNFTMFPLVLPEYGNSLTLENRIEWGTLPLTVDNFDTKEDTLESYVDNYLRQELMEEGLVRKLDPFARFLQVAAIMNGQTLNVGNIARDCKVGRTTVDKYFEILQDTLIGYRLPAYQPGLKVKEAGHPKFYFFDGGVARAAAGLTRERLDRFQLGFLLETFLLNEVRAYNEYSRSKRNLFHYGISGGGDVDLIVQVESKTPSRPDRILAIEMKLSANWDPKWNRDLESLLEKMGKSRVERLLGVYTGKRRLKIGRVEILPVDVFLSELHAGKLF